MNSGRTMFAQVMDFLPLAEFRRCVARYCGDYKVQSFSCWDQFLCLAFAQLTGRESLRDIEGLFALAAGQAVSHGVSRTHLAQHLGARQRNAPLAHLCRFRARADRSGAPDVSPRTVRGGVGRNRLCARFHDHRFVFVAVSLGAVSPSQKRGQSAHAAGSARQHSDQCLCDQRRGARRPHSRSTATRSGRVLSARPRLFGLRSAVRAQTKLRLLHHARQTEHPILAARLAAGPAFHRTAVGSNHSAHGAPKLRACIPIRCAASIISTPRKICGWFF